MKTRRKYTLGFSLVLLGACLAATASPPEKTVPGEAEVKAYMGTWKGTSTCVGDRPACKNETVVYRIVPFDGVPWQLRLLADKIINGKRVPMGALLFDYDEKANGIRCEFKRGTTHGVWSYSLAGDSLTGNLIVLPSGDKARDVRTRRVKNDKDVPPAPPVKAYEE